MEYVILMIIVIVIFTIVSRFLGGEPRKPSDRPSPTGKTRKDSWPAPRSAAAARPTTTRESPARPPQRPSGSARRARDPEIWETLSYSKSGEARRGPTGLDSVVPEFRFGGLQDDAEERAELREQLHEQLRDEDVDRAVESTTASGAELEPSPEVELEGDAVPDPEPVSEFGTTGRADFDLGTTPSGARPSSSGYNYSSIGSVYTSTSVYTRSSALGPDSAEPAQDVDSSEAVDEAEGEIGDAAEGNQPTGP